MKRTWIHVDGPITSERYATYESPETGQRCKRIIVWENGLPKTPGDGYIRALSPIEDGGGKPHYPIIEVIPASEF